MMFVDASALVAVLTQEPGFVTLVERIDQSQGSTTSALAVFETATAVCRKRRVSLTVAERDVRDVLQAAAIEIVPITSDDGHAALAAFARFGKGQGHPAQLNMGDCFAYGCAKTRGVPLLFVGNDFSRTDITSATA